jgi:hypothetical protein
MGVSFFNSFFNGNFIPIIVFHIITFYILSFLISRPKWIQLCILIFKDLFFLYLITFPNSLMLANPIHTWPFIDFLVFVLSSYFWKGHKLQSHESFQQISIMLSNTNISLRYDEYLLI